MITNTSYEVDLKPNLSKIIKVIGVGGGGGNAIQFMYNNGFHDVDFIVCNTDNQALKQFPDAIIKLQLGAELTKGLGAGTNPDIGRQAAIESEHAIREIMGDPTEMVFVTAGMGGGTGTGAAPEIARMAKSLGKLTIGVVTDPFKHEGISKIEQAEEGLAKLKEHCDTVLVIKNDRLLEMFGDLDIESAYKKADEVLADAVKSIAELITRPGVINADFADVKMVLQNAGHAIMGSAEASGPDRASMAIEAALTSPLLENNNIKGAKKILMSIAYSDELPEYKILMSDQGKITDFIESKIKSKAQVFKHGFSIDRSLKDKVRVTVVAAKFEVDTTTNHAMEHQKSVPGRGINNLIPNRTSTPSNAKGLNQTSLFEQDDKFLRSINNMIRNGYDITEIQQTPTFRRFGVELVDIEDIDNVDSYPLADVYEAYTKKEILN